MRRVEVVLGSQNNTSGDLCFYFVGFELLLVEHPSLHEALNAQALPRVEDRIISPQKIVTLLAEASKTMTRLLQSHRGLVRLLARLRSVRVRGGLQEEEAKQTH